MNQRWDVALLMMKEVDGHQMEREIKREVSGPHTKFSSRPVSSTLPGPRERIPIKILQLVESQTESDVFPLEFQTRSAQRQRISQIEKWRKAQKNASKGLSVVRTTRLCESFGWNTMMKALFPSHLDLYYSSGYSSPECATAPSIIRHLPWYVNYDIGDP